MKPNNVDAYRIEQKEENRIYLHLPGNVVFHYHNGSLTDLSEDADDLENVDSLVLDLKEQNSESLKLVPVNRETIVYLLDAGRKIKKIDDSLKKKSSEMVGNKREQIRKLQARFQNSGRRLMDIIERDLAQEQEALVRFDKMDSDKYFERILQEKYQ
jgi:hypothetical protein